MSSDEEPPVESNRARRRRVAAEKAAAAAAGASTASRPNQVSGPTLLGGPAGPSTAREVSVTRATSAAPALTPGRAGESAASARSAVPARPASPPRGPERPDLEPSAEGPAGDLVSRFLQPSKVPARIGGLVILIGLLNMAVALVRPVRHRLGPITDAVPGTAYGAATAIGVVSGILLLFLGSSLKRRRRRAWVATVVLLAVSVVIHVLAGHLRIGHGLITLILDVLVIGLLVLFRGQFRTLGDPTTKWGAARTFVLLLLVSLVVGCLLLALSRRGLVDGWPGVLDAISLTFTGMLGIDITDVFAADFERTADVVAAVLLGLGLMTAIVPVVRFFRSPAQPATLTPEDDARVRALLDAQPDSLGYFSTRLDKQLVWSSSGKAAIGYRVVGGVILAGGDPIGDPEAWPGAISAFLDLADHHGWTPAVLGCSEQAGTTWVRETGFQAFELGDEAIVDAQTFTLDGRPMRNVRQMVNRIRREGYVTELKRVRDTTPEERAAALANADSWRVGGTERGFSMATSRVLDAERDPDAVVAFARKDGIVEGMLQFVPWGSDGMSLDLMRRNPAADPGINELLIVDALSLAPGLGIHRVSLNFAMFRSTFERGERLGAGPVLRMWRRLLIIGNRWFQLESLYKFNGKFRPKWYPRYVIYPRVRDIARVGLAMGQAEAFIVFPRFFRFFGVRGS